MVAERWVISKRKWTINLHHHHNINKISSSSLYLVTSSSSSSSKTIGPCKRCFSIWNSLFLTHRPQLFISFWIWNESAWKNICTRSSLTRLVTTFFRILRAPETAKQLVNYRFQLLCTLQTLFLSLKIAIFWCIAPSRSSPGSRAEQNKSKALFWARERSVSWAMPGPGTASGGAGECMTYFGLG